MTDGTILIVDDEEIIRQLMKEILSEVGDYEILTAVSGEEGFKICQEREIDLVFTDLRMPGMGGLQYLELLKNEFPEIPVVIISGYGSREDVIHALRLGASNFLLKPVETDVVINIANRLTGLRNREKLSSQIFDYLLHANHEFSMPSDLRFTLALIDLLTTTMEKINLCSGAELKNVRLALDEALVNAIVHGNLEIDSRQKGNTLADLVAYDQLVRNRCQLPPYNQRRVHITSQITTDFAKITIADEGNGFNHAALPKDFSDIDTLTSYGRGLLLIRTFMDSVSFNSKGNAITMIKKRSSLPIHSSILSPGEPGNLGVA